VKDLSSGFRLYRRTVVQQRPLNGTDFEILEEILIRALAAGYTIAEVPFRYRPRLNGRSHVRLLRFGLAYLRTFGSMWKLRNSIASADYDARAGDSIVPLQRYWQRRRLRVISQGASGFRRVLDVGCGSSRILASHPDIVGVDIQIHKLRFARRYGNSVVHGSIFALPFADASFDCVICSEVVEHIPASQRAFDELLRVLRPEGLLILGTPDYDRWLWRAIEWLYGRIAPGGYADEHITHYGQKNLTAYLKGQGLAIERIEYVCACEMVLSLRRTTAAAVPEQAPLPVDLALRNEPAGIAAMVGGLPGVSLWASRWVRR
jgi:SAM-dependent methyltransferase